MTRPIATPATGALIGTPASISARLVPQTLAMELEPFDSRTSETTRMHVRERFEVRHDGADAAARQVAVADLAALRRPHEARLANRERREVVMQHEWLAAFAGERIDDLRVAAGAERRRDECLGLAAREDRRTVGARKRADLDPDRPDRLRSRPSMRGLPVRIMSRTSRYSRSCNSVVTWSFVTCGLSPPDSAACAAWRISASRATRTCLTTMP